MPSQELRIPFPIGGLTKNRGYQSSDPQTTRGVLNVTPDDSEESRTRGGTRPGLQKRYANQMIGDPQYLVRVSSGNDTRVYEYIVAGSEENAYLGKSVADGETIPISYEETFAPMTGFLCAEDGEVLITEQASEEIIIDEFSFTDINRAVVIQYQGTVIIGPTDTVVTTKTASTGTVSGSGSSGTLDDSGVIDWTTEFDIDPEIHWVDLEGSSPIISGTYKIASVSSGSITLASNPFGDGVTDGPDAVAFTIRVGIRQLDPSVPSVDLITPTAGTAPAGADAVVVFRDRVVWAINRTWYMSRQGDPGDYDYAADPEDPSRAIVGNSSDAGQPADPIVAMAPAGFDYLIIFSEASTWVMRGDPGYQGQLFNLSRTVGCVSARAWCNGDSTEIFFLAKDGLYYIPPNVSGPPQPLSPEKLPRELRGVDRDNFYITLVYDPEDHGVIIFIVNKDESQGTHYWFDIESQSFWPFQFARADFQPIDAVTFGGSPVQPRRVVMACLDKYIRVLDGTTDDGEMIVSHLVLGPYPMSGEMDIDGILTELVTTIDLDSAGTTTIEVYAADTAEEAVDSANAGTSPNFSRTVPVGRSNTMRPRVRGNAFCLRIDGTNVWAFEQLFAKLSVAGKTRR